ncbi:MAG: S8 family serine peptidase [Candidatus Riflebacteria bacterium]|nr:S8 family serine peptidase [Candidatus Riflebacteria bacterium]
MPKIRFLILAAILGSFATAGVHGEEPFVAYLVLLKPGPAADAGLEDAPLPLVTSQYIRRSTWLPRAATRRFRLSAKKQRHATRLQRLMDGLRQDRRRYRDFNSLWLANGMRIVCTASAARSLAREPEVAAVVQEPFLSVTLPETAARTASSAGSWQLDACGVRTLRDSMGLTGKGVVVGVLDTGVVAQGPLEGQIAAYRDFTSNPSASPSDPIGHGSEVASVLVGKESGEQSGVAPGCRLVVARVIEELELPADDSGRRKVVGAFAGRILEAMQWMLDPDGSAVANETPRIINNSWGFGNGSYVSQDYFRSAILAWNNAGTLAVFSSGNITGMSAPFTFFPASYQEVLAVGAVNTDRSLSPFSATGDPKLDLIKPDLVAPGSSVLAWSAQGGYELCDGTSFAAPVVSGTAALLLEAWPELSRQELWDLLTSAAADLGEPGRDRQFGAGLLNGEDAGRRLMQLAVSKLTEASTPEAFLEGLERVLSRQELPFAAQAAAEATSQYVAKLSAQDRAALPRLPGDKFPTAKRYLLGNLH